MIDSKIFLFSGSIVAADAGFKATDAGFAIVTGLRIIFFG